MSDLSSDDFRDLNDAYNILNRSPAERRQALIYFLRSGSVGTFHQRVGIIRHHEPDFILDLHKADLMNASLWSVNLANANLQRAQMGWADLKHAILTGADFSGAILMGADLRGAHLNRAVFAGADLRGANLEGASLTGCDLSTAIQGGIPPEMVKENPNYRKPAPPRIQKDDDDGPAPGSLAEGLSSASYSGPQRDYGGGAKAGGEKGPNLAEQAQKQQEEARAKKKADLGKFLKKKKQTEKFFAKKKTDQKKFLEKKKQNEMAYKRKQEEAKRKK
ncbi:MAG: pentapeptide repeat protein [Micavibrio sp.]|nr:pentapeptide repeat protein [Micavibrio sp.]